MKTNSTDKATPRPWATDIEVETFDGSQMELAVIYVNHGSGKGSEICAFRHAPEEGLDNTSEEQIHNARLIVKAVNEYAALLAVAEAAGSADVPKYHPLVKAIAALAAVREGKASV